MSGGKKGRGRAGRAERRALAQGAEARASHSGRGRGWSRGLGRPVPAGTVLGALTCGHIEGSPWLSRVGIDALIFRRI